MSGVAGGIPIDGDAVVSAAHGVVAVDAIAIQMDIGNPFRHVGPRVLLELEADEIILHGAVTAELGGLDAQVILAGEIQRLDLTVLHGDILVRGGVKAGVVRLGQAIAAVDDHVELACTTLEVIDAQVVGVDGDALRAGLQRIGFYFLTGHGERVIRREDGTAFLRDIEGARRRIGQVQAPCFASATSLAGRLGGVYAGELFYRLPGGDEDILTGLHSPAACVDERTLAVVLFGLDGAFGIHVQRLRIGAIHKDVLAGIHGESLRSLRIPYSHEAFRSEIPIFRREAIHVHGSPGNQSDLSLAFRFAFCGHSVHVHSAARLAVDISFLRNQSLHLHEVPAMKARILLGGDGFSREVPLLRIQPCVLAAL